jgi:hypothetical protein
MKNSKIILGSALHALGVAVYVALVAIIPTIASRIFVAKDSFWIPVAMLLLFVVSAAITGLLVLGRPIFLIYDGQKKDGLKMLFYTIGFLLLITIIVFASLVRIK